MAIRSIRDPEKQANRPHHKQKDHPKERRRVHNRNRDTVVYLNDWRYYCEFNDDYDNVNRPSSPATFEDNEEKRKEINKHVVKRLNKSPNSPFSKVKTQYLNKQRQLVDHLSNFVISQDF
ncbi:unnamed protein product [Amaranthus hypochondriacus]